MVAPFVLVPSLAHAQNAHSPVSSKDTSGAGIPVSRLKWPALCSIEKRVRSH